VRGLCAGKTGKEQRVKVSYGEGVANHTGLESCAAHREVRGEALTKVCTGQPLSRESTLFQDADVVISGGRQHARVRHASTCAVLRGQRPWHVQKLLVREPGDLRVGRREAVRIGKALSRSR
jgi:hypothetical protein